MAQCLPKAFGEAEAESQFLCKSALQGVEPHRAPETTRQTDCLLVQTDTQRTPKGNAAIVPLPLHKAISSVLAFVSRRQLW